MLKIGWRLLISRLLMVALIIVIASIALREVTNQQPPEPATTTTTTTIELRYVSIGCYIVTAYSSEDSCHNPQNNLCLMADGKPAEIGAIACPRSFDLGTRFLINEQEYICRDRLHINYDNRFDIWFGYGYENYLQAKEWGIKQLEIKIIQ